MSVAINAVVAIYIDKDGEIVASESIEGGRREIGENLLNVRTDPRDETEILKVEISVEAQKISNGCCAHSMNYVMRRICYDKFGRPYPCF